ncbi:very long-chain acyl-CoA synthetase-like, partial [Scleropages formosus]
MNRPSFVLDLFSEHKKQQNRAGFKKARWSERRGHGCPVLFMGNEPAFVFCWLALAKLGCTAALLNTNIRAKSLLHCFNCCGAKVVITTPGELGDAVSNVLPSLKELSVTVFVLTKQWNTPGMKTLVDKIEEAPDEPIPLSARSKATFHSPALYIYTSGTTGLPKPAVFNQGRLVSAMMLLSSNGVKQEDVVYINLPLYHATAFILGFIGCIDTGSSIILSHKFSASQFWNDCRKHNVTVIQYIGEVLRYLCNTPKRDNDRDHRVRLAVSSGVRAEKLFHYAFIQYDTIKDEPVRDSNGFCIEARRGETGLLVCKITKFTPFTGYARNSHQTEKKKLYNVFQKGDVYFNTGDLLKVDKDNFIYFQDHVGDTFRWKGENVSTTEVSDILTMLDFIAEANVYGVEIKGHEGRIGMAAVILKEKQQFDGTQMFNHVASYLPAYSRPRFLRIQDSLDITGTFKQMKAKLVQEGFNSAVIQDPLYFLDENKKSYVPMTQEINNLIIMMYALLTLALGLVVVALAMRFFLLSWFPYLHYDLINFLRIFRFHWLFSAYAKKKPFYTILDRFLEQVQRSPEKPFVLFEDERHTYADADRLSNRVAWSLLRHVGVRAGDTVALLLTNEPFYVWMFLGLAKVGCAAALLNSNLRSQSLLHCFSCSGARVLVASAALKNAVQEVLPTLREKNVIVFVLAEECDTEGMESLLDKVHTASEEPVRDDVAKRSVKVVVLCSPVLLNMHDHDDVPPPWTRGLPKAALINHSKIWRYSVLLRLVGVTSDDVIYIFLPLYHASGFFIGLTGIIERDWGGKSRVLVCGRSCILIYLSFSGGTLLLKSKFSASQFWDDCRKYNVTVIQYIGEIIRYLCNQPKKPNDRDHKVRFAIGNGIREDTWSEFLQRHGNIWITECYGGTENNVGFINYTGKIGASGRVSFIHKLFTLHAVVKYDAENYEPLRDFRGFCVKVPSGETGLLLLRITKAFSFEGYAGNLQQTEKKKLRDVFKKGDLYFNTGDLVKIDKEGFIYFQDRIGDTFRWKGENVATTEVTDVMLRVNCINEANVYGVKVP